MALVRAVRGRAGTRSFASIEDVAPTILYLLGEPIPADLEGRLLAEALDPQLLDSRPPSTPTPTRCSSRSASSTATPRTRTTPCTSGCAASATSSDGAPRRPASRGSRSSRAPTTPTTRGCSGRPGRCSPRAPRCTSSACSGPAGTSPPRRSSTASRSPASAAPATAPARSATWSSTARSSPRPAAVLLREHRRRRFSLVQVANPPDALLFCALPLRLAGAALVLDIHDLSPELYASKFAGGTSWPRGAQLMAALEGAASRVADHVLIAGEPFRQALISRGVAAASTSPRSRTGRTSGSSTAASGSAATRTASSTTARCSTATASRWRSRRCRRSWRPARAWSSTCGATGPSCRCCSERAAGSA